MERLAFGYLRMGLAEFESLTPRELQWRFDAEIERENRDFERLAQLACWVINPFLGKRAKPLAAHQLLKRRNLPPPED